MNLLTSMLARLGVSGADHRQTLEYKLLLLPMTNGKSTEPRRLPQSAIGNWQSKISVPMTLRRACRVGWAVLLVLLCTSCGDTFRPVAIPVTPVPPDPDSQHFAFMISTNGADNAGSMTQVDISGDSILGTAQVGRGPTHIALLNSGTRIYISNGLEDTVTTFLAGNGISPITSPVTISLPSGSSPGFVNSTETGFVYVANPGNSTVSAISTLSNVVTNTITVGSGPVAMAETPDAKKLYVANQGDNSVSSINPPDKTVNPVITDATLSSPVWVVSRSDSQRVYVLSQGNGNLTTINTFTDQVIPPPGTVSAGAGANFMLYDSHLNRLYVTNPSNNTLSIFDASPDTPVLLKQIAVSAQPLAVAALPDGSRVYVGSVLSNATTATLQVTVINATDNSVKSVVPVKVVDIDTHNATGCSATRFRIFMAAAASNARVYLGSCDAGGAFAIRTTDDKVIADPNGIPLVISSPVSAFPPAVVSISGASQNGSRTTYTYTLTSGTPLRSGLIVVVTGMGDAGNNGNFAITSVGSGTFTVVNAGGVNATGQGGTGVVQPPPQNPVFVVAGP